jgi:hypothetical protein
LPLERNPAELNERERENRDEVLASEMKDPKNRDLSYVLRRLVPPLFKSGDTTLQIRIAETAIFFDGRAKLLFSTTSSGSLKIVTNPALPTIAKTFYEARQSSVEEADRDIRDKERLNWKVLSSLSSQPDPVVLYRPEFVEILNYIPENNYWNDIIKWRLGTTNDRFDIILHKYKFDKGNCLLTETRSSE